MGEQSKVAGRVWTYLDEKTGRPRMRIGKHAGKDIDSVPARDLRWILDVAEHRPGPAEERDLREAAGEVIEGPCVRVGTHEWSSVTVGHYSFQISPEITAMFDEEMERLRQLFPSDAAAFEAILANSMLTPIECLDA